MWNQQSIQFAQCFDKTDKCSLDSTTGDSGFLSSSNSASFSCSSEFSMNSAMEDIRPVSMESMKGTDSGIDFSLSDSFDQLSLKQVSLNPLNSNNVHLEAISELASDSIDSGTASMSTTAVKHKEFCQEPWQLYFTQNEDGDTLLHTAIIQGYFEASLSLINMAPHPCFFEILNDDAQTVLHLAVITNQPKIVRRLVLAGADLSIRNHQGNTALHLACISGNIECAKALTEPITTFESSTLSRNQPVIPQNLEQRNYNGETCLHIAASRGHVELVSLLIHLGADLEAQESLAGRTALHLALEHNRLQVALYLVHECRPHLDAATYSGCTAYQIASCVDERMARELVRLGATPISSDEETSAEFREIAGFATAAPA